MLHEELAQGLYMDRYRPAPYIFDNIHSAHHLKYPSDYKPRWHCHITPTYPYPNPAQDTDYISYITH